MAYKKVSSYNLEQATRWSIIYLIRGHEKRKLQLQEMVTLSSPAFDGLPHATDISNPVERQALKEMSITELVNAVENALQEVPEKYRKDVFLHVAEQIPFPDKWSRTTYSKWQKIFLYKTAENLYWV